LANPLPRAEAGFSNLRRAAQTPVNLILELTP
jgi:hypothetical protein